MNKKIKEENEMPSLKHNIISNKKHIDDYLKEECLNNKKESWVKLDKTVKYIKIKNYIKTLVSKYDLSCEEIEHANTYLLTSLNKKKLCKVKEVNYNSITGKIENIPSLAFNISSRKFTLKRLERRVSTLKSLAPKFRRIKTVKHNNKIDCNIKDN